MIHLFDSQFVRLLLHIITHYMLTYIYETKLDL